MISVEEGSRLEFQELTFSFAVENGLK